MSLLYGDVILQLLNANHLWSSIQPTEPKAGPFFAVGNDELQVSDDMTAQRWNRSKK
jgi:hypothetical protein